MSRLFASLKTELGIARDSSAVAEVRMRLAIFFARRGDLTDAFAQIEQLRSLAQTTNPAGCTARANLAEGVLAFCSGEHSVAADKLRRAKALADLAAMPPIGRLSLAWQAHVALNLARIGQATAHIEEVLANTTNGEHATLSRVGMTLAVALHTVGLYESARPWYEFSRQHAVAEGDDLTLDALLHNVAAFRIFNLRLDEVEGQIDLADLSRAEQELNSGVSYDFAKSPKSFRWTFPILRIELLLLEQKFVEARTALEAWFTELSAGATPRANRMAHVDYALCLAKTGALPEAIKQMQVEINAEQISLGADDLAIVRFRQHQVAEAEGNKSSAAAYRAQAISLLSNFRDTHSAFSSTLSSISIPYIGNCS